MEYILGVNGLVCGKRNVGKPGNCDGVMVLVKGLEVDQDLHLRRCSVCERQAQYRCFENGTMVRREKLDSFRRVVGQLLDAIDG